MTGQLAIAESVAASALHTALHVAKGGAAIAAINGAATLMEPSVNTFASFISLRGGAASAGATKSRGKADPKPKKQIAADTKARRKQIGAKEAEQLPLPQTPEGKSVLCMAAGMAMHYLGYSLARSITVALFTSSSTGYAGIPGAFPFAMAFVSPLALALLLGYGKILQAYGPRGTLNRCTLFCASGMLASAALIQFLQKSGVMFFGIPAIKFVTGPLFVFRESYVQLLTSQYWSFMASVLSPDQSARWFAPISGLTSMSSMFGGMAVSTLAEKVGLTGALCCTGIALILSLVATNAAYTIAETHGFAPTSEQMDKKKKSAMNKRRSPLGNRGKAQEAEEQDHKEMGMVQKASSLFARVPVLRALFFEILASQGLATLLNVVFVHSLGASIPDDNVRAGWVGNFYALINFISMTLQFGVLPILMQILEPRDLWRSLPIISLFFTTFQAVQLKPTLHIVSTSLLVMKVLEYSARRMLDEMVYVPLDFESRFVGKEIIGVFGHRFGKSLMSLSLSGLTSTFGHFSVRQLSVLCDVAAIMWVRAAWSLSVLVPTRQQAQDKYTETRS